jgi:hypothetical protein
VPERGEVWQVDFGITQKVRPALGKPPDELHSRSGRASLEEKKTLNAQRSTFNAQR